MFDDDFVKRFLARVENRPEWNRPELLTILTDPERSMQRSWLSKAGLLIKEKQRKNVLRRLETGKHFIATYNELAVVSLLGSSDHVVDYEHSFEFENRELSPDLVLHLLGGDIAAIIEVSTKFRTSEQRSKEIQWKELTTRVHRIPRPLGLLVRGMGGAPALPPDSGTVKRLAAMLQSWLLSPSTTIGSNVLEDDYYFEVIAELPGIRADMAVPNGGDLITTEMVRDAVAGKVSRYGVLADSIGVPLVVILAAESASPLRRDLVRQALAGTQGITFNLDPFADGPVSSGTIRLNERDVPASFHSSLSLVGWLQPGVNEPGTLTMFPVASAARKFSVPLGERITYDGS